MKILMVLMGLDIGGAETHVVELSKQLQQIGHEVLVASNGGSYVQEIEQAGIRHIDAPLNSRGIVSMIKSFGILNSVIGQEKPDIVHAHARIPAFLCSIIHRLRRSFKFVTTVHGTYRVGGLMRLLSAWGQKTAMISEDVKKYTQRNYRLLDGNIFMTSNGVDTDKFSDTVSEEDIVKEFELYPEATRIAYVSRLSFDVCAPAFMLLDGFLEIARKCPNLECIIVGDGDAYDDLKHRADAINEQVGRLAVVMTGARTDVNKILACATVCVGVSRAALEAMAVGKPCILAGQEGYIGVFDESKLSEAMDCNFTCRTCRPTTKEELVQDLAQLLDADPQERERLGQYARRTVIEHYSVIKMAKENIAMYQEAMMHHQYDATLLGYYGFKNNGDEALLYSILNSLRQQKPDIRLAVLSYDVKETQKTYHIDVIGRMNIFKIYHTLKHTKLFIVGGGSLLQDISSTKSLLYYLFMIKIAHKAGCKTMLYANGVGPIFKPANRRRTAKILNQMDVITLRDEESRIELKNMGVNDTPMVVTADPAFVMTPKEPGSAEEVFQRLNIRPDGEIACIAVREWEEAHSNLARQLADLADYVVEQHGLVPLFIPMQYPYDAAFSRSIIGKMKHKAYFVDSRLDVDATFDVIAHSKVVISARLHTLIFATIMKVPALSIVYDPKLSGFQKYLGQPYFIDPRALQTGDYKASIDDFIDNYDQIKTELDLVVQDIAEKERLNSEIAIKIIEGL